MFLVQFPSGNNFSGRAKCRGTSEAVTKYSQCLVCPNHNYRRTFEAAEGRWYHLRSWNLLLGMVMDYVMKGWSKISVRSFCFPAAWGDGMSQSKKRIFWILSNQIFGLAEYEKSCTVSPSTLGVALVYNQWEGNSVEENGWRCDFMICGWTITNDLRQVGVWDGSFC